jgi:3-hydroxybutyryl-CoA dehydratase
MLNIYRYADIEIGKKESFEIIITEDMMKQFLSITGDSNPLHVDVDYAHSKNHSGCVVYGLLTASFLSTLAGVYLPGKYSLIHRVEVEFPLPVYIGDKLVVSGFVKHKNDTFYMIELRIVIVNQNGQKVCRGKMQIGVID